MTFAERQKKTALGQIVKKKAFEITAYRKSATVPKI